MKSIYSVGLALCLAAPVAPAGAATFVFSGSRQNVDAPGPAAARCGALATGNIRNAPPPATSSGSSNFGAFTPTLSHCIQLPLSTTSPTPFDLGEFLFEFATGDSLFGTYTGNVTPVSPGLFALAQTHVVTGGTGLFAGATGNFASSGTLSFLTGRPSVMQTFSGQLNASGVPEASTWAMMLIGFGAVGYSMRRRGVGHRVAQLV